MKKSKPVSCSKHQLPCTVLYPFCSAFLILVLVLQVGLAILNRSSYVVHNNNDCTNQLSNNQEHKNGDAERNNSSVDSLGDPYLSKLVEENYEAIKGIILKRDGGDICDGRRVFLYDVPPEFNTDLATECTQVGRGRYGARWGCLYCGGLENEGLGEQIKWNYSNNGGGGGGDQGVLQDTMTNRTLFRNINGFSANYSVRLLPAHSWFRTHQFALEPIFHAKMRRYNCLTPDPALADAFYVPYYAGQDFALSNNYPQLDARDRRGGSWRLRHGGAPGVGGT